MPELLAQLAQHLIHPASDGSQLPLQQVVRIFSDGVAAPPAAEAHDLWGSLPRLLAAFLARHRNTHLLFVTAHVPQADQAFDDLETFLADSNPSARPVLFPAAETHDARPDPTSDVTAERLRTLLLTRRTPPRPTTFVAPIAALMQPVPSAPALLHESLTLHARQPLPDSLVASSHVTGPAALVQWLTDRNFERVDQIDRVGQFSSRGGIIDIYPPATSSPTQKTPDPEPADVPTLPVRVEFFGDEIDTLRFFDLDTLRSLQTVPALTLIGCQPNIPYETASFLDFLPPDTLVVLEELPEIVESARLFHDRLADPHDLFSVEQILVRLQHFPVLYANRFAGHHTPISISFAARSIQQWQSQSAHGLHDLAQHAKKQHVYFFCENPAQQTRVREILQSPPPEKPGHESPTPPPPSKGYRKLPANLHLPIGFLHQGFALPASNLILVPHHEIFAQHQVRRRIRPLKHVQAIESFTDLESGDLVVHVNHGIARFRGLKTLTRDQRTEEFLTLEFAGKAVLHVPADKIFLVHKYVGARTGRVPLAHLGSKSWSKQKQKVEIAVRDLAEQLLLVQAARQATQGIAFPLDSPWQREFEDAFPYTDTDDQAAANRSIKQDMQQSAPMDRLLCGDVGYGKTELALRAAFKAVEAGKQVAVLVPTTVLAEQHYRTFSERLADFPFIVDVLNRFKTASQARDVLQRLAQGRSDILIGTHRILSSDVRFHDLGLVIIDEEQRFGVEHKEKLKHIRATVDVLTMTATPIPRTLHMALLGLRSISSLATPPLDRRAIVTEVTPYDEYRIRQAILAELARDGQVYFLHNRVQSIRSMADKVQRLVPEARIAIAHGQMPKHELEDAMLGFVRQDIDVLVCTTIIESGLDIPNANTIIINDADRFGLAELHQLRGRVGRYKNRAYACLLLPTRRTINPTAVKRLKAIEEYSQLGAGFRIALRDLEIRGAGNLLGPEQSGHIDAVGYELYCQMLARAVRQLNNEPEPPSRLAHLELAVDTHVPASYVSSQRQRMDVYRRLTDCTEPAQLHQLEHDLRDLFGDPPPTVQHLIQLAEIRLLASHWAIQSIVQKNHDLVFHTPQPHNLLPRLQRSAGRASHPDPHNLYLRLAPAYFESPTTLLAFLRKLLAPPV